MLFSHSLISSLFLLATSSLAPPPAWPESTTNNATVHLEQQIIRATGSLDGTLFCGNFATGSKATAAGLLTDLDAGANGKISHSEFVNSAGACQRVTCWDTTGVYVCNDESQSLTISGNQVYTAANSVYKLCCRVDYSGLTYNPGISGQKFIKTGEYNYNVIISYGDCNHPVNVRPSQEGGYGVNAGCVGGDINVYES
ncbi:hypothetical protein BD289DRAFT_479478 [Coniella lustricola]|uniref:EF-hand domain-containing protein n=1 Tax=Coniella lustricola TaxID=2025994 RepID=A0A2T3AJ69_9PEZI|nr:hypothetical protein BD289DRAFT_479478 [Coniella lustricola]